MSAKERRRMMILEQVKADTLTLYEAAQRMQLSYRQAKRVWRRFRDRGAGGLIHRSRGRISNRRIDPQFKAQVLETFKRQYADFGPTLAAEKLDELDGLKVNRETLRRWALAECLWLGRQRYRRHRKRRDRRARFGELVQIDGSPHRWFEQRAASCCLMVMVDDATGRTVNHFCEQETTRDALWVLRKWIERHGVPAALYTDRRTVYAAQRQPSAEEKRQGLPALTEFGRVCWELGIGLIHAHSAQAKGRVERKNGLLQDRLVKELRLRGIGDLASANGMLDAYSHALDERFAKGPRSPVDGHRKTPPPGVLDELFSHEETRVVQNDWTVSYAGRVYQIGKQAGGPAPRARVTVRQGLDGAVSVHHGGRPLEFRCVGRR